ncbi:alanine racemase [Altererythrobacter sp. B11]|uniref:alanine racemase n=1 Tax=Altererythrobacter sp. B11 TaxID=2060312 RepID=UPI000DC708C8|nr:alanine racemase [Altererythrobacter sp. B11]BBC74003.1 alanine racemase [Altererythrobacter sp. B11]
MHVSMAPDMNPAADGLLQIDLDAVVANYEAIVRQAAPAQVGGVVKADAYGLGAREISHALMAAGCRHFFVAHLLEAVELKSSLAPECFVYVLNGLAPGTEPLCAKLGAVPVLNSLDQLTRWAALAMSQRSQLPAVIQVDSGMSRLGLPANEIAVLLKQPHRLDWIKLVLIMSHLACADDPDAPSNASQEAAFLQVAEQFPHVPRSLDNSAGAFLRKPDHHDLVRPGIALFGGAPQFAHPNMMRPVVSLEAKIVQVREIPAGARVGYGLDFTAFQSSRIATIGIGYGDGWLRHLGRCGGAFIAGIRVPIAGRVSMDSITLDVSHVPEKHLQPGAPVELIGPHQTIDDVAADANTISYEILTRLGRRFHRRYLPAANRPTPLGGRA